MTDERLPRPRPVSSDIMDIVVLVKSIPDPNGDVVLGDDFLVNREGEGALDPGDEYAVEAALQLAEAGDGVVTVVSMGPAGAVSAIRRALSLSTGDIVIVQDADLEYDPGDWPVLFEPIIDGRADACFGSRFLGGPHRVLYYWHSVGNRMLTTFSNMLTNLNLTDMETCYKAIRGDLARSLAPRLTANRFGFEPEITARLAKSDARIFEVPISYSGRTYAEGKKIGWKDGIAAFWHITKFNLFS